MRRLGNFVSGLFLLLVFITSIAFAYFNSTPVAISFAIWQLSPQPVSVWVIGAFVGGGLLGLLLGIGIFRNFRFRTEIKRLTKQLELAKQEAANLRAASSRDI